MTNTRSVTQAAPVGTSTDLNEEVQRKCERWDCPCGGESTHVVPGAFNTLKRNIDAQRIMMKADAAESLVDSLLRRMV